MVVSFVCGLGVFGRIPITTTEATMPLSNCAKNIIRYRLKYCLLLMFLLFPQVDISYATECQVGDTNNGYWYIMRSRIWDYFDKNPWPTDYSCDLHGAGTIVSQSGDIYTYELINGSNKAIEVVDTCEKIYGCPTYEGQPITSSCYGYCNGHFDQSRSCFRRVWPACLTSGADLEQCNTSVDQCLSKTCRDKCEYCGDGLWYEHSPYGVVTCGLQSFCYSQVVRERSFYQWVCSDCTTAYNNKVTECGGSLYVSNWDNSTCTGECDFCPSDPDKTEPGICGCGLPDIDSDGDGTLDCNDGCPGDPDKTEPGICGCGLSDIDSDGDGTPDCNDGCPGDPDKTEPGICGCGLSDIDSDGDGTPDCNDGCPGDPDKIYQGYCGCGTPETDTDGDGTPDCIDECPEDPNKIYQGYCGCGTPETDTDSDGTPDCIDGCPDDPNKIAPGFCGCGTPDTDSDGDGDPDCIDEEKNYDEPSC
jgi:hypothetical protein